jgi:hypothetical protein
MTAPFRYLVGALNNKKVVGFSRVYYRQNTIENLKIALHEPNRKLGLNSDAPEGQEVPIPPVILVISINQ